MANEIKLSGTIFRAFPAIKTKSGSTMTKMIVNVPEVVILVENK